MVIFGFGHADEPMPLLTSPYTCPIGFIETEVSSPDVHQRVAEQIAALLASDADVRR